MIEPIRQLRNAIAIACALLSLGCHVTRNVNLVENPDAASRPSRIEVITKSGSTVVVYSPVMTGDSVRGFSDQARTNPLVLAASDIQSAKVREVSGGRTAILVAGIVAAVVAALFIALIIALSNAGFE
jgi:hypothetical protein